MEKDEERKFRTWCNSRGYQCLKLYLAAQRGFPDRTIITPTKVFFMEFKTPVGTTSPQQDYWLKQLEPYDCCRVFVPRSCAEAIQFIESQLTTDNTDDNSTHRRVKS